jgi:hypothetical protein
MDHKKVLDFFHHREIRREMALYAESGRAIHAWRAYRWIRDAGLPVPPWFLEYLDGCSERLMESSPNTPEQVVAAFDLGAKSRNMTEGDRLAAVEHVHALKKMRPDARLEDLFAEVGEKRDKSESYVREAYYAWFPKN